MEERQISSVNGAGKLDNHTQKNEIINSKRIKDLTLRPDRQKSLWHKSQQYLFQSVSQNDRNKNKNKQMGPKQIKLKSICTTK